MNFNFPIILISALIPLLIGFIWYHPKVFGNAWMALTGIKPEDGKKANMPLIFGLTYLFSVMAASALIAVVIHQFSLYSIIQRVQSTDPNAMTMVNDFMSKYGTEFRTFKHGALHGTLMGIFLILPTFAINSLFEQKKWKYIWINAGYWIVCLALMGGVICQWF
ncbi:MAG: DUF1761 domain-containing protein [Bacteroidia bacterium]